MRKWYVPAAVVGLSGMGMLLATEAGQKLIDRLMEIFDQAPDRFDEWNDATQRELDSIQAAVNGVAEKLGVRTAEEPITR